MQTSYYMKTMFEMVEKMKEATNSEEKIRALPNFKTAVLLRDKLRERGLTKDYANQIVTSMKIKVNDSMYEDAEGADKLLNMFADSLTTIFKTYYVEFGEAAAINFCKELELEFTA
jgi:hypothetical protein